MTQKQTNRGPKNWNTVLYDPTLPARDRLRRYTQEFDTAELNASFYRWPPAGDVPRLGSSATARLPGERERLPRNPGHGRRLYRPETWISRLVEGWHELGERRTIAGPDCADQERMTTGSITSCAASPGAGAMMLKRCRWILENSVLIANLAISAAFVGAMIICGVRCATPIRREHKEPSRILTESLTGGDFLERL